MNSLPGSLFEICSPIAIDLVAKLTYSTRRFELSFAIMNIVSKENSFQIQVFHSAVHFFLLL